MPAASPLLFDRQSALAVELVGPDMTLVDAATRQLAMGANRALVGEEIIQFARAVPLGGARWRLSGLWRGRGGTEHALAAHAAGEAFVVLDGTGTVLDPAAVGDAAGTLIAAIGLADTAPVTAPIGLRGIGSRPLSPVHSRSHYAANGDLAFEWTRRARGAWTWPDAIELPLNEQNEAYMVTFGNPSGTSASWDCPVAGLVIPAAQHADLRAAFPDGTFAVHQRGDRGLSLPLRLPLP